MSAYYYLCCMSCEVAINFGKKLHAGNENELQGVYSETKEEWVRDRAAWLSIQGFFQEHEGHDLSFCREDKFTLVQWYEHLNADRWNQS